MESAFHAVEVNKVESKAECSSEWLKAEERGRRAANSKQPLVTPPAAIAVSAPQVPLIKESKQLEADAQENPKQKDTALAAVSTKLQVSPSARIQSGKTGDLHGSEAAWGMDSMASLNISGNKSLFIRGLRPCKPVRVTMADGNVVETAYCGDVVLHLCSAEGKFSTEVITDVHYHPKFAANLLSWNVLRSKHWQLHSTADETYIVTPTGAKVHLSTRGRVSVLDSHGPHATDSHARVYSVTNLVCDNVDSLVRLHERLGHVGFDTMITQIKKGATTDVGELNVSKEVHKAARRRIMECKACTQGKGTRQPFGHRGLDHGSAPGEVLHMDTFQVRVDRDGRSCLEYGLLLNDPYCGGRWFQRLLTKDEGAGKIIAIVSNLQTQLQTKVKRLYADGGTEFINQVLKEFCARNGTELHYPPARTQQLNGIAERNVRTIKDMGRTLLLHAGMPQQYWFQAVKHGNYLWNRTHVSKSTGKTPYEVMYKRKPSARHWGVFGCDAYYHLPKAQREVFERKMEPCIYLGHDEIQNCAIVLDLNQGKEIRTRDVEYREASFTHAASLKGAGGDEAQNVLASPPAVNPSAQYEVERILAKRVHRGRVEYHVKWADYGMEDATWEPVANIEGGAQDAIDIFESEAAEAEVQDAQPAPSVEAAPVANDATAVVIPPVVMNPPPVTIVSGNAVTNVDRATASTLAPRRSPRFRSSLPVQSVTVDDNADSSDLDQEDVHMAMSAISDMQDPTPASSIHLGSREEMVCAVAAGIALLEQQTPATYKEAMSSPDADKWRASMDREMASCEQKKVWTLVPRKDLPPRANILPCKWVYKVKVDSTGAPIEWKSRITPKGFRQKEGVDYFEVFAATGRYKTMRVGLSLAARWDHELEQMDVPTAFLNADVDEEVYMELPEGYRGGKEGMVCKLDKSLYGLKQASRNWYLLVSGFIVKSMGFKATISDPCLFYKRSMTGQLIQIFLFVDDMQISFHRVDRAEWNKLKSMLVDRFQTKDLGESKWILGMRISRDRKARIITLDQELYVTKALEKYGLAECKVAPTPEVVQSRLTDVDEKSMQPLSLTEQQRYMEITGTLMYAGISTRPDISHAVHRLASHMQAPTRQHMLDAERCLRYLAGTKEIGLHLAHAHRRVITRVLRT